jgi:hypothetical protein
MDFPKFICYKYLKSFLKRAKMIKKDAILEHLNQGMAIFFATRNAKLQPHTGTGLGALFDATNQVLTLFLNQAEAQTNLTDMAANGHIVVTLSSPVSARTVQMKGFLRNTRPLASDDAEILKNKYQKFTAELEAVGHTKYCVENLCLVPDLAITVQVTEIYDQTPGLKAGAKIE